MLWPDTFNNYFFPEVLEAATNVLQSAGYEVMVPRKHFCCGRPLYDYGMLDKAKSYLQRILDQTFGFHSGRCAYLWASKPVA